MATAPTQYYLTFKANCCGEYDVYESHRCQEKGCLWTSDEYITTCIPGKESVFVEDYHAKVKETDGIVCGYEVVEYCEVEE